MLRRLSRPVAALFALWFAFVMVDPMVLHACPMHDGMDHSAHAVQSAHAAQAAAADQGHASHHGGAPKDKSANLCSCMGHCAAATVSAPVPVAPTFAVPVRVAQPVSLFAEPAIAPPASPDVSLPFANGPPQA